MEFESCIMTIGDKVFTVKEVKFDYHPVYALDYVDIHLGLQIDECDTPSQ